MNYKQRLLAILLFNLYYLAFAQVDPAVLARTQARSHTFQHTTLPYRLYVPENYMPVNQYPLLLFLHGAMWAGTDNITQLDNELALYWMDSTPQASAPCFVVYPQIPGGVTWESTSGQVDTFPPSPQLATANDIIDSLSREFSIDPNRLYLSGKSIGALGVYGLLARHPNRFAAAAPAAGMYLYTSIAALAKTPLWIFHNRDDNVVSAEQSRFLVREISGSGETFIFTHCNFNTGDCLPIPDDAILAAIHAGAEFLYSEFDATGHQLEPNVVRTLGLYEWMMRQDKAQVHVGKRGDAPGGFLVIDNYPNPFNEQTTFTITLPAEAKVTFRIYNVRGQLLETLLDQRLPAGVCQLSWQAGERPSGVYFYRATVNSTPKTGRCLLVR